jgi:hypothetical protein
MLAPPVENNMPEFKRLGSWVEPALKQHLKPVAAPPELRARINAPARADVRSSGTMWGIAVAAAALAFAAVTAVAWTPGGATKPAIRQAEMAQARALVLGAAGRNVHAACNVCHTI